ncbi:MAG: hypothetical protein FIA93_03050 [Deltaproteobacteria bacterium]|nr:hypothetical protein [Deltaproteobacteria bacterium]
MTGSRLEIILACGRLAHTKGKGGFRLARDDWKYHDEDMEDEEENKPPPSEIQCGNCLRWIPRESPSCSWCGKRIDKGDRHRS